MASHQLDVWQFSCMSLRWIMRFYRKINKQSHTQKTNKLFAFQCTLACKQGLLIHLPGNTLHLNSPSLPFHKTPFLTFPWWGALFCGACVCVWHVYRWHICAPGYQEYMHSLAVGSNWWCIAVGAPVKLWGSATPERITFQAMKLLLKIHLSTFFFTKNYKLLYFCFHWQRSQFLEKVLFQSLI